MAETELSLLSDLDFAELPGKRIVFSLCIDGENIDIAALISGAVRTSKNIFLSIRIPATWIREYGAVNWRFVQLDIAEKQWMMFADTTFRERCGFGMRDVRLKGGE